MLFCINYCKTADALFKNGALAIDRYKCPDWPDLVHEVTQTCHVAVHFDLIAGNGHLAETDWEVVDRLAAMTDTPYINVHLGAMASDYPSVSLDHPSSGDALQITKKYITEVNELARRFGSHRVIVENVPYTSTAGKILRTSVEPEIITCVIQETDCGLLLDLAHARISAHYLGMPAWDYVMKLPLERLKELHITGVQPVNGVLNDHLALTEEDWAFLKRALEMIRLGDWPLPWMAAFEYGGLGQVFAWRNEPSVIANQAPKLYRMIKELTD